MFERDDRGAGHFDTRIILQSSQHRRGYVHLADIQRIADTGHSDLRLAFRVEGVNCEFGRFSIVLGNDWNLAPLQERRGFDVGIRRFEIDLFK